MRKQPLSPHQATRYYEYLEANDRLLAYVSSPDMYPDKQIKEYEDKHAEIIKYMKACGASFTSTEWTANTSVGYHSDRSSPTSPAKDDTRSASKKLQDEEELKKLEVKRF